MCGPSVRYFGQLPAAYVLAYEVGRAEDLAAVISVLWDADGQLALLCRRCGVAWEPCGITPPPCEHLTAVAEDRRDAHAD